MSGSWGLRSGEEQLGGGYEGAQGSSVSGRGRAKGRGTLKRRMVHV